MGPWVRPPSGLVGARSLFLYKARALDSALESALLACAQAGSAGALAPSATAVSSGPATRRISSAPDGQESRGSRGRTEGREFASCGPASHDVGDVVVNLISGWKPTLPWL